MDMFWYGPLMDHMFLYDPLMDMFWDGPLTIWSEMAP